MMLVSVLAGLIVQHKQITLQDCVNSMYVTVKPRSSCVDAGMVRSLNPACRYVKLTLSKTGHPCMPYITIGVAVNLTVD